MSRAARRYCVYMLTCKNTNKSYVGVTSQPTNLRWRNGKGYVGEIRRDIDAYGWDNFDKKILETELDFKEAAKKEKKYIAQIGNERALYNKTCGGEVLDDCAINLRAEHAKGRILSPATRAKIAMAKTGIKFTATHIEHLRLSHIGNQGYWTGKSRDCHTRQKISNSLSCHPIICVETGEIFKNLKLASMKTGVPVSTISKICSKKKKSKKYALTFERRDAAWVSQS